MRRVCLVVAAVVVGLPFVAATPVMAGATTLTVTTLGRNGALVTTTASVLNLSTYRVSTLRSGRRTNVAKGRYAVLANIEQGYSDATLGGRIVSVAGRTAVTIDARQGRPVRVSLNAAVSKLTQRIDVRVCAGMPGWAEKEVVGSPGDLFVIPNSSNVLSYAYESVWSDNDSYQMAKDNYIVSGHAIGLPIQPGGSFRLSSLATVNVLFASARKSPVTVNNANFQPQPSGAETCQSDLAGATSIVNSLATPIRFTTHMSAGRWLISAQGDSVAEATPTYRAGKRYSLTLKVR